jgi:hypothetical protein
MFLKGSRYAQVENAQMTDARGRAVNYKKVRFIPPTPRQAMYTVAQSDRLDLVAARFYRDPLRFWRIADANLVMWPDDLVSVLGAMIAIPPSEG